MRKTMVALTAAVLLLAVPIISEAAQNGSQAGRVSISGGWLNIRSAPSSTSARVSTLKKGSYIELISKSGTWWQVEYSSGSYGYCHSDYITPITSEQGTVSVSSGALNVRTGPGTAYPRQDRLTKGKSVLILEEANGWSRILYNGTKTGYVSSRYLSSYYEAVSISVPSFKQNDPRWAELTLGESGKTFAKIGCATTAIAMMESHRRGYAVYPDEMSQELRYTASGSVYWPSDYIPVTDASGSLEKIYDLLRQGKPVLFGSRNRYGTQHYVVITGFSGGETLKASGFRIHDPGTYSRTDLQQFMNAYPSFYKFFYY